MFHCFFACADVPPPTVQQLLVELGKVSDDWYTLGVALGVPVSSLRKIKMHGGTVEQWKIDMFQLWLDLTPTASWKDITRVLEQLDHLTLAAGLKSKYLWNQQQPSPVADSTGKLIEGCGVFELLLFFPLQLKLLLLSLLAVTRQLLQMVCL